VINVTRLNGKPFVLNAELIRIVEANPDTTITLTGGEKVLVKESPREVVEKAVEYGRRLRALLPPT
jgi:flagellar protein FlbD